MLLLFNLLMMLQVVNMQLAVEIYPCSDETKNGILHFSEYTHVEICCQLVETWCNKTTSNDTLTLLPATGCSRSCISQMDREDACLVKFEISNASSADEGGYVCTLKQQILMHKTVHIIKKPPTPVITSFTCSYINERTIIFDRGPPSSEYYDTYNVTMLENTRIPTVMMCNATQLVCKPDDRLCVCKIKLPERVNGSLNVTIYVTVNRSVQTSWAIRNFTVAGNIIPGPIMLLNVSHVGPHDAQIKFCMHTNTRSLCGFMDSRGAAHHFHLLVYRVQGTPEILNVTIPKSDISYGCYLCRLVQLPNLIAYTNYTVIVFNSGGGGESNKSQIMFTTTETAPVYPPVVDDFGFRRLDNCTASSRPQPCLIVIWKPLPHEAKGGRELSYYIEVFSEDGFQTDRTTVDAHAVISHQDLPAGPLTVKLWSQNVLGRTLNYTRFDIPPKSEAAVPYVLVELNGDHAFVYVNLTSQTDVQLVIQWCNSDINKSKSDFYICQDYPSTAAFSLKAATGKSFQKFKVEFSTNMFQEIQYYQPINYYELVFFNSSPNIANSATARVTKNAYNIIQDMDYYFDGDLYDPLDASIYFNLTRKRRYVQESISSSEAKIKFSISFKKQEMANSGMIPANCYFDAAKEKVELTISQFQESSSNAVSLRWLQDCNTDIPQQFLADYFHVYSSTDEHCTENKHFIDRINNTLFQPNVLKLPSDTKFACIQTFRSNGVPAADLDIHAVKYAGDTTKEIIAVVVSAVVGIAVFVILVIVLIYCCRKRKQVVDRHNKGARIGLPTESTLDVLQRLLEEDATHGVDFCSVFNIQVQSVAEQTVPEQTDAISSNSSGDSGRGTDDDSKHLNAHDTSYANSSTPSSGGPIMRRSLDNSDFPGDPSSSGTGITQETETLETDCSVDNYEDNENDDSAAANERVHASGGCRESYSDCDQQEVLRRKGLSFNCNISNSSNISSNSSNISSNSSSSSSNSSSSSSNSSGPQFPVKNDKNNSSSSSSSGNSIENAHNSNCFSEPRRGDSGKKVNSSNNITESNANCGHEEENISYSVGSSGSDRERDQKSDASFHSNNGSGGFRHFESAGGFGQHFENHTPSDSECRLNVPLNRCFSSGSESEGDAEKPFIHASDSDV